MTPLTRKVVVNRCYGAFGLSREAFHRLAALGHPAAQAIVAKNPDKSFQWRVRDEDLVRDDPRLVHVVEELGGAANGEFAALEVVEIPADVDWQIEEYDGSEWVAEKHRTW